jgi:hypothetical protein
MCHWDQASRVDLEQFDKNWVRALYWALTQFFVLGGRALIAFVLPVSR